ncbi:DUF4271 domain-containing protein [Spongiimicrobium sp. 3-5]|uniref:DUF4271 domain-containing protein n=1 Tax=Spongiimicrobium sp. 3-5 TaxID=3332596 RepID=UPI00398168CA
MEPILRSISNTDWITLVIFTSILCVVAAKGIFYVRFMNFVILPFNNKYIFMYNKKDRLLNWFHILFTFFQVMNFALLIYFIKDIFFASENTDSFMTYLLILGLLLLFLLIKVSLQLGNGFIFGTNKTISEFIFKKLSYLNYSGIIMFLANVILAFVAKDSKTVVYVSIFLILLINCIGWVTVVKNHQKFIAGNFFYFILYLCALEITPFVIIGSFLKD